MLEKVIHPLIGKRVDQVIVNQFDPRDVVQYTQHEINVLLDPPYDPAATHIAHGLIEYFEDKNAENMQ